MGATLLRLLGQVILPKPENGRIFVPPHLRILHSDKDVQLLDGSFLDNILLGKTPAEIGGLPRVRRICELVGFQTHVMRLLEEESANLADWFERLSGSGRARVNLARVLVANPEVLIMHKPLQAFNEDESIAMV